MIDPNNAAQIKEKGDTDVCARKAERAEELMSQASLLNKDV